MDAKQSIADTQTLSELKSAISEIESKTLGTHSDEIPSELDKFYVNRESEQVTWVYYNPDSSSGGQFVYTYMSYDDIFNAMEKDDPLEYLNSFQCPVKLWRGKFFFRKDDEIYVGDK